MFVNVYFPTNMAVPILTDNEHIKAECLIFVLQSFELHFHL